MQSVHGGVDFSRPFRIDVGSLDNYGASGADQLTILIDDTDHQLLV